MFDIEKITKAQSVADTVKLLGEDADALIIAGGTDVLIQVREGKLAGRRLISIHDLPELKGISLEADGTILIRPLSTFAKVTESEVVQKHIPTLGFATDQAGGPQLRNAGTIGGNVCNGVTSADSASTLLTLNAELELVGPNGSRKVKQEHFYKGPGKVDKAHEEVLVAIRIAKGDYDGFFGHYIKYAQRNAMDIATLGCAVHVKPSADKAAIEELRLAFGVAGPTPIRCHGAEELAKGAAINDELLEKIAGAALEETNPRTSWRASKEFRTQLIYELSKRAVRAALQKAGAAGSLAGGDEA